MGGGYFWLLEGKLRGLNEVSNRLAWALAWVSGREGPGDCAEGGAVSSIASRMDRLEG